MTTIPDDFQLSASNLQDFIVCARRFELRHLQRLSWPGLESRPLEEAEQLAQLGIDFHRLVHQHLTGLIDEAQLTEYVEQKADKSLEEWWHNYLTHRPTFPSEAQICPELKLTVPLGGYRLTARFDLLIAHPEQDRFVIIDWKTTPRKPSRERLLKRVQSRVYPYVLTIGGASFNTGEPIPPENIQMIYWYPHFPMQPELFDYDTIQFHRDEYFLNDLLTQIKQACQDNYFPLVTEYNPCLYCRYRSFCGRGEQAGLIQDQEEEKNETELDIQTLDWEQIAEIQF